MIKPSDSLRNAFMSLVDSEEPHDALYKLFIGAISLTGIVLVISMIFIKRVQPGEFGDFFGGILNPLLTFITFMALLITIVLQHTELRESRDEFSRSADALESQIVATSRQSFESTFFQMLSLHNQIVNSIDLRYPNGAVKKGRDCFSTFYTRLTKLYRDKQKKTPTQAGSPEDRLKIDASYKEFWRNNQLELGHYFRYLYNVIRFIKESDVEPGRYIRLVRPQLSDQELLLLFYNCLSPQGLNFLDLVEEFSLLDNLPKIRLLEREHANFISNTAFERPPTKDI